ncbi:MAG: hypothetical protein Q9181_001000 [Wetmoreana brouardii]
MEFFKEDICALKSNPSVIGSLTAIWHDVDQDPVNINAKGFLVPKDFPSHLRTQIEHTKLVPKGYAVLEDSCLGLEILVPDDDLIIVDRCFSRGDVVKKHPLAVQSGTVIRNSVCCTVQPKFRVTQKEQGDTENLELVAALPPIPNVDSRHLRPYRIWNEGDALIYQDWIGTVKNVYESMAVAMMSGSVVVIHDTEDVKEYVSDPVGSMPYEPTRGTRKPTKDGHRWIKPDNFYPGQKIQLTQKALLEGRWLQGAYSASNPYGQILRICCRQAEVTWKQPRPGTPWTHITVKPPTFLSTTVLESGDVTRYDTSRGPTSTGLLHTEDPYQGVPNYIDIGGCVVIKDPGMVESMCSGLAAEPSYRTLSSPSAAGISSAPYELVLRIVSTTSKVKVYWQDNSVTDEDSTSICPYTEVDDYDVWPGELVSLKDQEISYQEALFEKMVHTQMVGVIQSVNAAERIARIRWFQGADLTITGEYHAEIVEEHSTFGTISDHFTENSLYEIKAYLAIVKRRGDTVCIRAADVLVRAELTDPAVTPDESMMTVGSLSSDRGIRWFGEIIDLTLDGRIVVRLGALEYVRDVACHYMDIHVAASADDTTTDSSVDLTDTPSSEEVVGLRPNPGANHASTTVEYDGPTPSDIDERQWTTDSNEDDSSLNESQNIEAQVPELTTSSDKNANPVKSPDFPEDLPSSDLTSAPAPLELLDGSSPQTVFKAGHDTRTSAWFRAVYKEYNILQSSLPEGVYVRTWASSMNIMRVLIVGPSGTPYALAPFLFDIHLHQDFPNRAPEAFFHSWTNGIGRVNPNLYEDGKICLSLLGTWHSDKDNEAWVPGHSSVLQVIVSLLGLVLVKEPFYNEAGFESLQGTIQSQHPSAIYSEKAFVLSRGFVSCVIQSPPAGFADIVRWLYLPSQNGRCLLKTVVEDCQNFLRQDSSPPTKLIDPNLDRYHITSPRLSRGALVMLKKVMPGLEALLSQCKELFSMPAQPQHEPQSTFQGMDVDKEGEHA